MYFSKSFSCFKPPFPSVTPLVFLSIMFLIFSCLWRLKYYYDVWFNYFMHPKYVVNAFAFSLSKNSENRWKIYINSCYFIYYRHGSEMAIDHGKMQVMMSFKFWETSFTTSYRYYNVLLTLNETHKQGRTQLWRAPDKLNLLGSLFFKGVFLVSVV